MVNFGKIGGLNIPKFFGVGGATAAQTGQSIFNFEVDPIDGGKPVSLSKYKGKKAYLVVNVASKWGLTTQNYAELKEVYGMYR